MQIAFFIWCNLLKTKMLTAGFSPDGSGILLRRSAAKLEKIQRTAGTASNKKTHYKSVYLKYFTKKFNLLFSSDTFQNTVFPEPFPKFL